MFAFTGKTWSCLAAAFIALLFALTWLVRPIQDPDFFWHLKMGEWLWQHHSWPIPDPFAFTTPAELGLRQLFIIKGYWLSQLLYFAAHAVFGWPGIYCLRLGVFAVFALILWKHRQGNDWLWGGAALACLVVIFDLYPVERPQFFSFVLFAWLYLLLDSLWRAPETLSRHHFWTVALLMMLWGNLHGGVLLGQVLWLVAVAVVLVLKVRGGDRHSGQFGLCALALVGLLAGCFNPNAFRMLPGLLQSFDTSAHVFAVNDEFASVVRAWQGPFRPLVIIFGVAAGLSLAATLTSFRRQPVFGLLVLVGIGGYAAMHIRYIPFFLLTALPVVVRGLAGIPLRRGVCALVAAGALILTVGFAWNDKGNLAKIQSVGWVSDRDFPVGVADQILNGDLRGRLFNLYRWGGYLLWRLGPERQVFIDGRALDETVSRDALTAEMVRFGGGRVIWKEIFDKYQINYAILPLTDQGRPYALTHAISQDPLWRMVFTSGNAVLLARR